MTVEDASALQVLDQLAADWRDRLESMNNALSTYLPRERYGMSTSVRADIYHRRAGKR